MKMKTKKIKNLEIKLEEQSIESKTSEFDTTTGGIGVYLTATICDGTGNQHSIFEGQVRGTGRYGDDFRHWYREIEDVKCKDEKIYITLNSGLLKDVYVFNPRDGNVTLEESVNLEELRKQNKIDESIENLKDKPLMDILDEFGSIIIERDTYSGTRKPKVLRKIVDEEQKVGIIVIGKYKSGYDPAMDAVELYAVRSDSSFQELKDLGLKNYDRPKFSETFLSVENLELTSGRVTLTGEVLQKNYGGFGGSNRLDYITHETSLGDNYKSLDEL